MQIVLLIARWGKLQRLYSLTLSRSKKPLGCISCAVGDARQNDPMEVTTGIMLLRVPSSVTPCDCTRLQQPADPPPYSITPSTRHSSHTWLELTA